MTLIMPIASAESVPGRMAMCQSAACADRVRTGSTTTTRAPRFCASAMKGHMWVLVLWGLQAHSTMYFEYCRLSGSMPAVGPSVMM